MPVRYLLVLVTRHEHAALLECGADELHADRQVVRGEAAREGERWHASERRRDRADVFHVHGHGIIRLLPYRECGVRRRRSEE